MDDFPKINTIILRCYECKHRVPCRNFHCTSEMCNLTKECFHSNFTATHCPLEDNIRTATTITDKHFK